MLARSYRAWFGNGRDAALRSFGIAPEGLDAHAARAALKEALPRPVADLLERLDVSVRVGNVLFVHAGVDPNRPLAEHLAQPWHVQSDRHWAWIRYEFLGHEEPFEDGISGKVVHRVLPMAEAAKRPGIVPRPRRGCRSC